jgi:hypothetical protein
MTEHLILWKRLDCAGHDLCRLQRTEEGFALDGVAVFVEGGLPTRLEYTLRCDRTWQSTQGQVQGFVGTRRVEVLIVRNASGAWSLNGEPVQGLDHCLDLDFGFTPATNVSQLRRVALTVGQSADVPAAWLDVSTGMLDLLPQRYERRTEATYWYDAPRFGYAALLEVAAAGFVRRYPTLWEVEAELCT